MATTGHGGKAGQGAVAPNLEYNPKALPTGVVPTAPRSLESVRRETLRNFLGDWTRSRGKMPPRMRQAATLYAEGKSQSEIAGELGIDQATVSRMLTGALKSANAAR